MSTVELRHCGCDGGPPGINARNIVIVYYCAACGGFVSAGAHTIDECILQLTEMRDSRSFVFAHGSPDGVQYERRPAI
jgi:hypothetical protein